jgi:hypothetical protein
MNRVAAEVAEKVGVLLEDDDVDSHARQKETQHYARWPASHDAAPRSQGLGHARKYTRAAPYLDSRSWNQELQVGKKEKAVTLVML